VQSWFKRTPIPRRDGIGRRRRRRRRRRLSRWSERGVTPPPPPPPSVLGEGLLWPPPPLRRTDDGPPMIDDGTATPPARPSVYRVRAFIDTISAPKTATSRPRRRLGVGLPGGSKKCLETAAASRTCRRRLW